MNPVARRCFSLLALAAVLMSALLGFLPAAGHDQLWFLLMGRRWLQGATLYGPEIFDSNPPLVIWLSALPVRIGALSHCEATLVAKGLVLCTGTLVAALAWSILKTVWRPLTGIVAPALLFAFVTLFFVAPARDLGQRDALAGLLALPYVLASARRPGFSPRQSSLLAAALLAAVGFCLKPQVALLSVAVELGCLVRSWRRTAAFRLALQASLRRPEIPVLLGCGALYLLAIRLLAPLYFTEALPLLRDTYWAIGGLSLPALFGQAVELMVLLGITVLTFGLSRPVAPASVSLLTAGCGAAIAYLLQGTGWYYQQLPAMGLVGAALALHLLELERRHPLHPPGWAVPAVAATCLLAVALTTHFMGYPFTRARAFALSSPDPALFQSVPPGTPVAILTTSVDEAMMPIEEFHLTWAQRTDNLWLLPAILLSESTPPRGQPPSRLSPAALASLEALQHRWMLEDLARWQPRLVLVERCAEPQVRCQVLEDRHVDLLAWFQRDPAFDDVWRHYRLTGRRDRFDTYTRQP